jgi:hypothetical protein
MKKYLMTGVAALAFAATFTSCSKTEDLYNANAEVENQKKVYSDAFVAKFGKIASSQSWGFNKARTRTRGCDTDANMWAGKAEYEGIVIPKPINQGGNPNEAAEVIAEFSKVRTTKSNVTLPFTDFFIQQVYKGEAKYPTWADQSGNITQNAGGSTYMNELSCGLNHDHTKNFNGGTFSGGGKVNVWTGALNSSDMNDKVYQQDQMELMINSSTACFSFKNSWGDGEKDKWYDDNYYVLEWKGSYYVGFDYQSQYPDASERGSGYLYGDKFIDRDYIYNDWIVKITPAYPQNDPDKVVKETGRIICEDLGTADDFDFNDIVFDATIYTDGTCDITILAAGGRLDVTVAGEDIHAHTGKMTTKCNYSFSTSGYDKLIDIPIVVSTTNSAGEVVSYELAANAGAAPQKICVPKSYKWCTERTSILEAHPQFKEWVNENDIDTWATNYVVGKVIE